MACKCIEKIDDKLAPMNGRIAVVIPITSGGAVRAFIEVEKINKRGKRPPLLIATFCPYCGTRYEDHCAAIDAALSGKD